MTIDWLESDFKEGDSIRYVGEGRNQGVTGFIKRLTIIETWDELAGYSEVLGHQSPSLITKGAVIRLTNGNGFLAEQSEIKKADFPQNIYTKTLTLEDRFTCPDCGEKGDVQRTPQIHFFCRKCGKLVLP